MKTKIVPFLPVLSIIFMLLQSCEDSTYKEYTGYAPVYLSYENLRSSVALASPENLKNPGKIYFKDNYIFIVEELKGIHIYDNANPASPVNKAFVKIPGVVDISVSGYTMYADSYVDLVILDVQNIDNIKEVGRVKNTFPYTVPAYKNDYPTAYVDQDKGVVTDWELKTLKEAVVKNPNPYPIYNYGGLMFLDKTNSLGASQGVSGNGIGVGGSMARFGIKDKALYIVNNSLMKVFDISNKTSPAIAQSFYPGWNIETLFLHNNNMFLGTTTGMSIYDISSPLSPTVLSFYNHIRSCDPVVVDDTIAYVTIRSGVTCGGTTNVLDIVSVRNLAKPALIASYPMTNPHGLGKDGDLLFICDGSAGLKVFNAADPKAIPGNLIYTYPGINAYDVIPVGKVLMLISDEGLFQYDYSNVKNISLLSTIPIEKD